MMMIMIFFRSASTVAFNAPRPTQAISRHFEAV